MRDPDDLDPGRNTTVTLTAHVLAALAEAQSILNSDAAICASEAINTAKTYIEGYLSRITVRIIRLCTRSPRDSPGVK